jgi:CheY-like chemotaxis protein
MVPASPADQYERVAGATNGIFWSHAPDLDSSTLGEGRNLARVEPLLDLILLDVMMPDMNGYDVCDGLKAIQETRDIPVIFLT